MVQSGWGCQEHQMAGSANARCDKPGRTQTACHNHYHGAYLSEVSVLQTKQENTSLEGVKNSFSLSLRQSPVFPQCPLHPLPTRPLLDYYGKEHRVTVKVGSGTTDCLGEILAPWFNHSVTLRKLFNFLEPRNFLSEMRSFQ